MTAYRVLRLTNESAMNAWLQRAEATRNIDPPYRRGFVGPQHMTRASQQISLPRNFHTPKSTRKSHRMVAPEGYLPSLEEIAARMPGDVRRRLCRLLIELARVRADDPEKNDDPDAPWLAQVFAASALILADARDNEDGCSRNSTNRSPTRYFDPMTTSRSDARFAGFVGVFCHNGVIALQPIVVGPGSWPWR